jgi:hypothetical protein
MNRLDLHRRHRRPITSKAEPTEAASAHASLQRTAGNRAVATGVAERPATGVPPSVTVRGNHAVAAHLHAFRDARQDGEQFGADASHKVAAAGQSGGQPLPDQLADQLAARLGVDLSAVRLHTDGAAAQATEAVHAHAFTQGTHVFFSAGAFDPGTRAGRHLLVHELTHVKQHLEGRLGGGGGPGLSISSPGDATEMEAEAVAGELAGAPLEHGLDALTAEPIAQPFAPPIAEPVTGSVTISPAPTPAAEAPVSRKEDGTSVFGGHNQGVDPTAFKSGLSYQSFKKLYDYTKESTGYAEGVDLTEKSVKGKNKADTKQIASDNGKYMADAHDKQKEAKKKEADGKRSKLGKMLNGQKTLVELDIAKSFDVPLFLGLMLNLGFDAKFEVKASTKPSGDVGSLHNGAALSAEATWTAQASAEATGNLKLGLGAGVPNAASAGVRGVAGFELSGGFKAELGAEAGVGKLDDKGVPANEAYASISAEAGIFAKLVGKGSIEPYLKIGGKELNWNIPLASYDIASWTPKAKIQFPPDKDGKWLHLPGDPAKDLKINVPDWADKGITKLVGWLTADNDAHAAVQELKDSGRLALMSASERAALFAAVRDGVVLETHEGSLLDLIRAEPDVEKRWAMLTQAWIKAHTEDGKAPAPPARPQVKAWVDGAIDNHLFGDDNQDALNSLLTVRKPTIGPAPSKK